MQGTQEPVTGKNRPDRVRDRQFGMVRKAIEFVCGRLVDRTARYRSEPLEARRLLSFVGDFNNDFSYTATDIDLLSAHVRGNGQSSAFDLDNNSIVNAGDLRFMVESVLGTRFGDANLDGAVNAIDSAILQVNFGLSNVGWASGDFDGSGRVDFGDVALLSPNNPAAVIGGPILADRALKLGQGLLNINTAIDDWAGLFNLTPIGGQSLPGVDDSLATLTGLAAATANIAPQFSRPSGVVSTLASRLDAIGLNPISLPVAPGPSELIVGLTRTFTTTGSAPFDDATGPLLNGLSSALNLDGNIAHRVDLTVDLKLGVDASGFYLRGDSTLSASLAGDGVISGSYALPIATLGLNLTGTLDADFTLTFTAGTPTAKVRTAQLVSNAWTRAQSGQAVVDLDLTLTRGGEPTPLAFGGAWSIPISGTSVGPATGGVVAPSVNDFVDAVLPVLTDGARHFLSESLVNELDAIPLPLLSGLVAMAERFGNTNASGDGSAVQGLVGGARATFDFTDIEDNQGSRKSDANRWLKVIDLRRATGMSGEGMKIGVISDGVQSLQQAITLGDLPAYLLDNDANGIAHVNPAMLDGFEPNGDARAEGIAMMEIIHDLAPGATLYFSGATLADPGTLSPTDQFLEAVDYLLDAGVDVIVDDLQYTAEPRLRDGPFAQALSARINAANAAGRDFLFVTAAGNHNREIHNDVFTAVANVDVDPDPDDQDLRTLHRFRAPGLPDATSVPIAPTRDGEAGAVTIEWDRDLPAGGVLRILVLDDATGEVILESSPIAGATRQQIVIVPSQETIKPLREFGYNGKFRIAIEATAPVPDLTRFSLLFSGKDFDVPDAWKQGSHVLAGYAKPEGGAYSHPALNNVLSVGAADEPMDPSIAPYQIAPYSVRGPSVVDFQTRNIPQLVGIDGNDVTAVGPFKGGKPDFDGTSSTAPQAAAIAALLKQRFPATDFTQITQAMMLSASSIAGGTGGVWNPKSGFGLMNALAAGQRLAGPGGLGALEVGAGGSESDRAGPRGLDLLQARGITVVDGVTTTEILGLIGGSAPASDLLVVRYNPDLPVIDGTASFDPASVGALGLNASFSGSAQVGVDPAIDLTIGVDAQGVFLSRNSSVGATFTIGGTVFGSVGTLGVTASPSVVIPVSVGYAGVSSNPKLRITDAFNPASLTPSIGTVAGSLTLDIELASLDYVDNNPTIPNGPHGGDPFVFRATSNLTATQQAGWDFDFTFSPIDLQNPSFGGGNYSFANFLTNLYRYGEDQLAGSGYLGNLLDALQDLVQPLSDDFRFGDQINEDLIQLVLDSSNVQILAPANDQAFFAGVESWLNTGGTSNFEIVRARATITNLDLIEVLTVGGDLGEILRNANQPLNLSNALLNGTMEFGIDTAGGLFVDRSNKTNLSVNVTATADLSNDGLLGPYGAGDFMRLDDGSILTINTTARVLLGGTGKLRLPQFFHPISGVTSSLDPIVVTLAAPGADLLPRVGSNGYNARVNTVNGTATFTPNNLTLDQLTLSAASSQWNLFDDELRLTTGPLTFNWNPQGPSSQTLLSVPMTTASFPNRPGWPGGTLSNLQLTGSAVTLGSLSITGSDFALGELIEVRTPTFGLSGVSIAISPSAVTALGGVSMGAASAAIFPDTRTPALDGHLTTTNPTFTLNSAGLRFTATNASFKVGSLLDITATGTPSNPILFNPDATGGSRIMSLPVLSASVPKLTIDGRTPTLSFSTNGTTPGLALRGDGRWDIGAVALGFSGGGTATFGLGSLVPLEIGSLRIAFDSLPGGGSDLNAFSAFLNGSVDTAVLNGLLAPIFGSDVATHISITSPQSRPSRRGGGAEDAVELKVRVDSLTGGQIGLEVSNVDVGISSAKIGILEFDGQLSIGFSPVTGLPTTIGGGLGFVVGGESSVDPIDSATAAGFDANRQGGSNSVSGITLEDANLGFAGSISSVGDFDLSVDSGIGIRFKLADIFELYGVRFGFDFDVDASSTAGTFSPVITGGLRTMAVRKVRMKFGDFLTITGGSSSQDAATLDFTGVGNIATFGPIAAELPQIRGSMGPALTGTVNDLAITQSGLPNLLPFPGVDDTATLGITGLGQFFSEEDNGIFSWLPISIQSLSVKFLPEIFSRDAQGNVTGIGNPAAFDLGVSGSIGGTIDIPGDADPELPFSAGVDGLVLDMLALYQIATTGSTTRTIIKDLRGVSGGVDPFALLPEDQAEDIPFTIGGSFGIGRTSSGSFYVFVNGEFKYQDFGGSVTIAFSDRGPLVASLSMPLAVPIGPTPFVLSGARGAIVWGIGELATPESPSDMLDNPPAVPTQIDTSNLSQLVQTRLAQLGPTRYTWDEGVAMGLGGTITLAGAPDGLAGNVDLAINIGRPKGTPAGQFGIGVQVYGQGTIDALGFPLAETGLLFDFVDPIEPQMLLAFRSPAAGNPLGFLFPANAEFAVQLKTEGVVMAPIVAVREFINNMTSTAVADLDAIALRLESDRLDHAGNDRLLTAMVLDSNNDGTVSPAERATPITRGLMVDRLIGAGSGILPSTLASASGLNDASLRRALRTFNGFQQEYYHLKQAGGANVVSSFLQSLADSASLAGLAALDQFNPSLAISGKIQPVVFGFPVGDALAEATITIGKEGVGFEVGANLTALLRKMVAQNNPVFETMAYAISLGLDLRGQLGFFRDFSDEWSFIVNGLLGRDPDPNSTANDLGGFLVELLNPFDDWSVNFSGQVEFLGFPIGRLSGLFFGPESQSPMTTTLLRGSPGVPARVYVADPFGPLALDAYTDFTRIPVSSQQRIDNMAVTGGLLLTGELLAPAMIQDPVGLISLINQQVGWTPPAITGNIGNDLTAYQNWINGLITGITTSDEFARLQMFVPSPALLFDLDNLAGPNANYLSGDYTSDAAVDGATGGEVLTLDVNGNGRFDTGDAFADIGNGRFDAGESFTDSNGNGIYDDADPFDDLNGDRTRQSDEPFYDLNSNGTYDALGEPFVDVGNGIWDGPVDNATARLPRATSPATISTALTAIGNAFFIEGYTDPKLLGLELGRGKVTLDAGSGLQFQFQQNWLGVSVNINAGIGYSNQDLTTFLDDLLQSPLITPLIGGTNLNAVRSFLSTHAASLPRHFAFPTGFAELDINTSGLTQFLAGVLKLPASIISVPAAPGASFSLGMYTPGYKQPGTDVPSVQVQGGLTLDAKLDLPGLLEDATMFFELTPPKLDLDGSLFSLNDLLGTAVNALPDFTARGSFSRFGPSLGNAGLVRVDDMLVELRKRGPALTATLLGDLTLLPGTGEINLSSNSQLTADISASGGFFGVLDFELSQGSSSVLNAVGFRIDADFELELNTTSSPRTVLGRSIAAGTLRLFAQGELGFGPFGMDGSLYLSTGPGGFIANADVSTDLGPLGALRLDGNVALPATGPVSLNVGLTLTPPPDPIFAVGGQVSLQFNSASNPGVYSVRLASPSVQIDALDIDWSLPADIEIGFNASIGTAGAFFFDLNTTQDLSFTLLPGVFDQSITISEFRLYADTAGNFIFGGPGTNSRASFSFSPAIQLVPGFNFVTLESVGIRIVREASAPGQPFGRLLYDFSLFGEYDFLGITGTIQSRLNASGCFILEIDPDDDSLSKFGVYLDLNDDLVEQFIPAGIGDPIPAFEPSNAPCTPDSMPGEPFIPPPPSVQIDIATSFRDSLASAPYGSYITGTEPDGLGGTRRFIRVELPEQPDTIRLRSYGYPAGFNINWQTNVTVPSTLARINRATQAVDFSSLLSGSRVLSSGNRNVNLSAVLDDVVWEFDEQFFVDFIFTPSQGGVPVIAGATRIYYTILNDEPETEDALAYYEFNGPTTPTGGFTRSPTHTFTGVTGSLLQHSSQLAPINRALSFNGDRLALDLGASIPSSFTFEMLVRPDNSTGDVVIAAIGASATGHGITIIARHATQQIILRTGTILSPNSDYVLSGTFTSENWIAFSYSSSSRVLVGYLNGVATNSTTLASPTTFGSTQVVLGSATSAGTPTFRGVLDEVRLYSGIVSGSTLIANRGNALEPNAQTSLVSYFRFDEPGSSEVFRSIDSAGAFNVPVALRGTDANLQPATITSPFTLTYPSVTPISTGIGLPRIRPDFAGVSSATLGAITPFNRISHSATRLLLDLDETSSTTTLLDRSALQLNGTIQGGENASLMSTAGAFGQALAFDGNDWISVANSSLLPGPGDSFTVSFMLNMSSWVNQNDIVVSSNVNGIGFTVGLITAGGQSGLSVAATWGDTTRIGMYETSGLLDGGFVHFAVEFDGDDGIREVWVDGTRRTKIANNHWLHNDAGNFTLGRRIRGTSSSAFLSGVLDDFAILEGVADGDGALDAGRLVAVGNIGAGAAARSGEFLDFTVQLDPAALVPLGQRFFVSGLRLYHRSSSVAGPTHFIATVSRNGSVIDGAWGSGEVLSTEYTGGDIDFGDAIGAVLGTQPTSFNVRIWALGGTGASNLRIDNLGFLGGIVVPPFDAQDDFSNGSPGQTIDIDVLANDEPVGAPGFNIISTTLGSIITGTDGRPRIRVDLPAGATSDILFSYVATNGTVNDTANVSIRLPVNAIDDLVTVAEDTPITFDPTLNDHNPSGTFSIISNTNPASGTLTRVGNSFTFTPASNFNGSVSFTYTLLDSRNTTDTATVTINVTPANDPPVVLNPTIDVPVGLTTFISRVSLGSDPDAGDTFTVISIGTPSAGTASIFSGGTGINYTAPSTLGSATLTYTLRDASGATTTGTLTLNRVNNAPVVSSATAAFLAFNRTLSLNGSASDPDGHALTYTWALQSYSDTDPSNNWSSMFAVSGSSTTPLKQLILGNLSPAPTATVQITVVYRLTASDGFGLTASRNTQSLVFNYNPATGGWGFSLGSAPEVPSTPTRGQQHQDQLPTVTAAEQAFATNFAAARSFTSAPGSSAPPSTAPTSVLSSTASSTRISVRPVAVAVPSALNSTSLPSAISSIEVGQHFFVEVWVQDLADLVGITGGSLDLNYATGFVDAIGLQRPEFNFIATGTIQDALGLIDNFGGATLAGGLGIAPSFTRLGYVEFVATAAGQVDVALSAGAFEFALFGIGNVPIAQVDLSQTAALEITSSATLSAPQLALGQDTGVSASDNITRLNRPIFSGSAGSVGQTLELLADGSVIGSTLITAGGAFSIQPTSALADGTYSFTLRLGSFTSGPTLVQIDSHAPTALVLWNHDLSPHQLRISFSESIFGLLSPGDISLVNLTTATPIAATSMSVAGVSANQRLITFPGLVDGRLTQGRYQLMTAGGTLTDLAGNSIANSLDFSFTFMPGDANGDGAVNFSDLLILARNYNTSSRTFSQADFNYDGLVAFADLLILARNYNQSLPTNASGSRDSFSQKWSGQQRVLDDLLN